MLVTQSKKFSFDENTRKRFGSFFQPPDGTHMSIVKILSFDEQGENEHAALVRENVESRLARYVQNGIEDGAFDS
jgi:hypothetical protein